MTGLIDRLVHQKWLIWVSIIGLIFGRKVNISSLLGWGRVSNYLDIVIDLKILIFFVFAVYIGAYLVQKYPLRGTMILGYLGVSETLTVFRGYSNWYHFLERGTLLFLLGVFSVYVWRKCDMFRYRLVFVAGLLPFVLFDHFLLSESSGVFLIWISILLHNNFSQLSMRFVLPIFSFIQFIVTSYQVFIGKSVGLYILGESVLAVSSPGLATISINGVEFLRGYGLFVHPNILGFFGVLASFYLYSVRQNFHDSVWKILVCMSICVVFLSGSRGALLSLLCIGIVLFGLQLQLNFKNLGKIVVVGCLGSISFLGLLIMRGFKDDLFRLNDFEKWLVTFKDLSWWDRVFGVGLGQYPFFLQYQLPLLESWQYEPVHNFFLLVLSEIGLLSLVGFCGILLLTKVLFLNKNQE